jgi:hypothetical protein
VLSRGRTVLLSMLVLSGVVSCGDDSTGLEDCGDSVAITVSAGLAPEFSWSPVCAISGITVEDAAARATWIIENPDNQNTIGPPVVYGHSPPGTIRLAGVDPLFTGFPFTVVLFRTDRSTGQVLVEAVGQSTFTP